MQFLMDMKIWRTGMRLSGLRAPGGAVVVAAAVALLWWLAAIDAGSPLAAGPHAASLDSDYAGSTTCQSCHEEQYARWRRSHHALAMQPASKETMLGGFDNAVFDHHGVKSRFFRRNGKFFVETDGRDGALQQFQLKYAFGIYPLQQYLIAFPDGRLQALSIAWDARPREQGGQRWFHLYPDEKITHTDVLHWTRLQQNWNFMCADCHSTNVHKNYDAGKDRFSTTWSEINVGCEACHGPGAKHLRWAADRKTQGKQAPLEDTAKGFDFRFGNVGAGTQWSIDSATGSAAPQRNPVRSVEVEVCGRCHARRGVVSENWKPGSDLSGQHAVSLLSEGLFEHDGQMRDEVYNYQAFKQSKMYAAGVTCRDCHDPHGATLRAGGTAVCAQCHDAGKFETVRHHFHVGVDPPVTCISCHMPKRTYMVVDPRHDHSFRIPRPDLSVSLGTPNACNDCHKDKTAKWAAQAVERWYGPKRKGFQNYASAFHAARTGKAGAAALLKDVAADPAAPAIARATAYAELGPLLSPGLMEQFRKGFADPDPLVRIGALRGLEQLPPRFRWPLASALLADPIRAVRLEAASFLAPVPPGQLNEDSQRAFDRAAEEYIAARRLNADRPEARSALGNFLAQRGRTDEAEAEFQAALRLEPSFVRAAVNLADLYRRLQRDHDAEATLRRSLAVAPRDAAVRYALGLALVRLKRMGEALEMLRIASELEPGEARYAYVYAIALDSMNRRTEALGVLHANVERHPHDVSSLSALVSIHRETGDMKAAQAYAKRLERISGSRGDGGRE